MRNGKPTPRMGKPMATQTKEPEPNPASYFTTTNETAFKATGWWTSPTRPRLRHWTGQGRPLIRLGQEEENQTPGEGSQMASKPKEGREPEAVYQTTASVRIKPGTAATLDIQQSIRGRAECSNSLWHRFRATLIEQHFYPL